MKVIRIFIALNFLIFVFNHVQAQVKMWEEPIVIPTWEIGTAEVNPTFSWSASFRKQTKPIYPYAFKEILTNKKSERTYKGCWLENEFIKVLVLPEIGGRLHGAQDKTNDYNFFYWQPTIKPALIGMTGAWISGGIEWNFPTGHRPTGFSPMSYRLTENPDGSKTIWVGETEWIYRMRWVVGITVYPGKSIIEAKVRLLNPTPLPHSFYMWATTAVNANENYQAIYPTRLMAEHGKYEFFHWPVDNGVDISWWKNSPNASSYFAMEMEEFFGGYDHGKQAGTVLTGNKHIVIGKKLWTWGTSPFGRMWEPILTEGQGPYFEPQAGAYSDNQPDYHWLEPGEVKSYSHFFFPVRDIGPFKKANVNGALNLEVRRNSVKIGVYSTAVLNKGIVRLTKNANIVFEKSVLVDPANPFVHELKIKNTLDWKEKYTLSLFTMDGEELLSYTPEIHPQVEFPEPAEVFSAPEQIQSNDELFHTGEIIYKFRDSQKARSYFREVIKRDSGDSRSHILLAELDVKQGKYKSALDHLEFAEKRDTDNGKIFYLKALVHERLGDYETAYNDYYRSVHFGRFLPQAYERIARLDLRNGDYRKAINHIGRAIENNSLNAQLWALKATALRLNNDLALAEEAAGRALELDPLHPWALHEVILSLKNSGKPYNEKLKLLTGVLYGDYHCYIELALQYLNSGLYQDADSVLELADENEIKDRALIDYYQGYAKYLMKQDTEAKGRFAEARRRPVDDIFPFRLETIDVLRKAIEIDNQDATACYYLGLVYAGIAELDSAVAFWQKAVNLDPKNGRAWRCLGLGHFTYFGRELNLSKAREYYQKAFELLPEDSRILLEFERVKEALGEDVNERLAFLKQHRSVVESRDDLLVKMLDLMVRNADYEKALQYYTKHHFHNWEGQYSIHNAYMEACIGMAEAASSPSQALELYNRACKYPENLEVAPREPNLRGFLYYPMAMLHLELSNTAEAQRLLDIAASEVTKIPTVVNYYQALTLRAKGETSMAETVISQLEREARQLIEGEAEGYIGKSQKIKQALGYYYLSKVFEMKNNKEKAQEYTATARKIFPLIEREALIHAQVTFAGAHQ